MAFVVEGMQGMGDTVYQRPALGALSKRGTPVYVRTSWPQLYEDMPHVRVLRPSTNLRTQSVNALRYRGYHDDPPSPHRARCGYKVRDFQEGTHPSDAIARQLGVQPDYSWFPLRGDQALGGDRKPVGIVHAATVRQEWYNGARPCKTEYLSSLVRNHPEYTWISLAWICGPAETWYDDPPQADERYEHGELQFDELLQLLRTASVIVSCVGFCLPLGPALGTPTLILYGGDVPPSVLEAPWMGPLDHVAPDPFCACYAARHNDGRCNKELDMRLVEEKFACLTGATTTAS